MNNFWMNEDAKTKLKAKLFRWTGPKSFNSLYLSNGSNLNREIGAFVEKLNVYLTFLSNSNVSWYVPTYLKNQHDSQKFANVINAVCYDEFELHTAMLYYCIPAKALNADLQCMPSLSNSSLRRIPVSPVSLTAPTRDFQSRFKRQIFEYNSHLCWNKMCWKIIGR